MRSGLVCGGEGSQALKRTSFNCDSNVLPRGSRCSTFPEDATFIFTPFHFLLVDRSSDDWTSIQYAYTCPRASQRFDRPLIMKKRSELRGRRRTVRAKRSPSMNGYADGKRILHKSTHPATSDGWGSLVLLTSPPVNINVHRTR